MLSWKSWQKRGPEIPFQKSSPSCMKLSIFRDTANKVVVLATSTPQVKLTCTLEPLRWRCSPLLCISSSTWQFTFFIVALCTYVLSQYAHIRVIANFGLYVRKGCVLRSARTVEIHLGDNATVTRHHRQPLDEHRLANF